MGPVGACSGVPGGCTIGGGVSDTSAGMYGAKRGIGVGTRQEVVVLGLGSCIVGTHPVFYSLTPPLYPLPNPCELPVVLQARAQAA